MLDLAELKICFIAGTLGQGGAERQLFHILQILKRCGSETRVLCLTRGEYWEKRLIESGIDVRWVGQSPSRPMRLARIIADLRHNRPQIVQSQHFFTNPYAVVASRILGLREVGAIRGDADVEVSNSGRLIGVLGLLAPRTIAANSEAAIRRMESSGIPAARLHLLRNVVDTDVFTPGRTAEQRAVTICAVGRLVKQKRFDRLLNVFAKVRSRSVIPVNLIIAGDGPLLPDLKNQISHLGLEESVELRGIVPDPRSIYREADILALTSDWEGTPNVVLEAMACGLPVVASSVGDLPFLIRGRINGFLVDSFDVEEMVAVMLELIDNPDLRTAIGRRARADILEKHSVHQLPDQLQKVYEAVLR